MLYEVITIPAFDLRGKPAQGFQTPSLAAVMIRSRAPWYFLGRFLNLGFDLSRTVPSGCSRRITSYNVCYTKLLRARLRASRFEWMSEMMAMRMGSQCSEIGERVARKSGPRAGSGLLLLLFRGGKEDVIEDQPVSG